MLAATARLDQSVPGVAPGQPNDGAGSSAARRGCPPAPAGSRAGTLSAVGLRDPRKGVSVRTILAMTQHAVLPAGFHSVTTRMIVNDVAAQVEFLRAVFDATGEIHPDRPAEIRIGSSAVLISRAGDRELVPAFLYIYVDDADRVYERALVAGAVSIEAPVDTPYGDRRAMVRDVSGNVLQIAHRFRPATPQVTTLDVTPIGWVESPLTDRSSAPHQADEGAPEAWLVFAPSVVEGLLGLHQGDRVIVITWLDRARRDVLTVHPRGDAKRPLTGVFDSRSPDRPNPIGLHTVEITGIEASGRVRVRHLEALNNTPILDVKPVLSGTIEER
jgi:tRNA-Thr(GGU) m(6)t(6)A37 methyltransferase TsaA